MEENLTNYKIKVQERSTIRYIIGFIPRFYYYLKFAYARNVARRKGAIIGEGVSMSLNLAKRMNSHVKIGDHVNIETNRFSWIGFDITIGNNVIIGRDVKIQLGSHNIDSPEWENIRNKPGLIIEDYVWLCPDSVILPGCQRIGRGAVVGANSVVVKDVDEMSVVSGWPAKELRKRNCVHTNIVVESYSGNDLLLYKKARKKTRF